MPSVVHRYHDGTKHHFHQFARSLGYLDWASQPAPFRSFTGAPVFALFPSPDAAGESYSPRPVTFDALFDRVAPGEPIGAPAIGDVLRHALGLSAWKQYRESRWALRVNPSSGNLHPTEAYLICGALPGLASSPATYHYAPDRHALEQRCGFAAGAWESVCAGRTDVVLMALTSIHWREAWKYGERAFRYCQHDLGHAIAAIVVAAAMHGWRVRMVPAWSHRALASLTGLDRDEDFIDAEREEPACLLAIGPEDVPQPVWNGDEALVAAVRAGQWSGRASQLSQDHVQWTFIDEIARATEDPGRSVDARASAHAETRRVGARPPAEHEMTEAGQERLRPCRPFESLRVVPSKVEGRASDARSLVLQRRSAVALDGRSSIDRGSFFRMLARVMPGSAPPWNALWWTPRVHLALFVHRVDDVVPGLYLLPRREGALDDLRTRFGREFLWEPVHDAVPLVCLGRGDCRRLAARLSCDQEIAADGFFSLGMLAELDASLDDHGPSFYRNLFWETGVLGQILYLEAEMAGARATGIGCFYDDPVHETLGLQGHAYQSLYHFTVGIPVEDTRLTSAPGYAWS